MKLAFRLRSLLSNIRKDSHRSTDTSLGLTGVSSELRIDGAAFPAPTALSDNDDEDYEEEMFYDAVAAQVHDRDAGAPIDFAMDPPGQRTATISSENTATSISPTRSSSIKVTKETVAFYVPLVSLLITCAALGLQSWSVHMASNPEKQTASTLQVRYSDVDQQRSLPSNLNFTIGSTMFSGLFTLNGVSSHSFRTTEILRGNKVSRLFLLIIHLAILMVHIMVVHKISQGVRLPVETSTTTVQISNSLNLLLCQWGS